MENNNDNKDILSQEEVDALLRGDSSDTSGEGSGDKTKNTGESGESREPDLEGTEITDAQKDAIGEIGNISFGTAATTLSVLLNRQVEITTPKVSITNYSELKERFPKPHVLIEVGYTEGLKGMNVLIIKMKDAKIIADLMMGGDGTGINEEESELEEFHLSAVSEAMNQMMGSASTSMSTMFNEEINISPPSAKIIDLSEADKEKEMGEEPMVKVAFRLKIEGLIDSEIMQIIPVEFARDMATQLLGVGPVEDEVEQAGEVEEPQQPQPEYISETTPEPEQASFGVEKEGVTQEKPSYSQQHVSHQAFQRSQQEEPKQDYQPVQFSSLEQQHQDYSQEDVQADTTNMGLILDVPLEVTVELGRTRKLIKEILELVPGSIIELEKLAGEPVDIKVNGKLIAKGEVVVIDENFGIRVTEIVSQAERVNKLQ